MGYMSAYKVRGSGLTDKTKVDVLEAIAFFKNEQTGICCPSTEKIALIARVHQNNVRKAIKALEDDGFITVSQKEGCRRFFVLNLDLLPPMIFKGDNEDTPLNECEPLNDCKGGNKSDDNPLTNIKETPQQMLRRPLNKGKGDPLTNVKPNKEYNKELNKEINKEDNKEESVPSFYLPLTEKEEKPTKEKRPHPRWIFVDRPDDVAPKQWKTFCDTRASKRLTLTEEAFEQLRKEAKKADLSLSEVIDLCNKNGWGSFRNSWNWKGDAQPNRTKTQSANARLDTYRKDCTGNRTAKAVEVLADGSVIF